MTQRNDLVVVSFKLSCPYRAHDFLFPVYPGLRPPRPCPGLTNLVLTGLGNLGVLRTAAVAIAQPQREQNPGPEWAHHRETTSPNNPGFLSLNRSRPFRAHNLLSPVYPELRPCPGLTNLVLTGLGNLGELQDRGCGDSPAAARTKSRP
jgi:hypothetical protein